MTSYYDHILGLIPVAFVAVAATLTLAGYGTTVAIPAAGGVAVALVGHALFVNGPRDDPVVSAAETPAPTPAAAPAPDDPVPTSD
ncbi:MAG: hypothetical protein ABEJ80_03470 [Halarchaeum sp.]